MLAHQQDRNRSTSRYMLGENPRFEDVADKILHGSVCPSVGFPPGTGEREALFGFVIVFLSAGVRQTKDDPIGNGRDEGIGRGLSQGTLYLRDQSRGCGIRDAIRVQPLAGGRVRGAWGSLREEGINQRLRR